MKVEFDFYVDEDLDTVAALIKAMRLVRDLARRGPIPDQLEFKTDT